MFFMVPSWPALPTHEDKNWVHCRAGLGTHGCKVEVAVGTLNDPNVHTHTMEQSTATLYHKITPVWARGARGLETSSLNRNCAQHTATKSARVCNHFAAKLLRCRPICQLYIPFKKRMVVVSRCGHLPQHPASLVVQSDVGIGCVCHVLRTPQPLSHCTTARPV